MGGKIMVGVGITVHNRIAVADLSIKKWRKMLPKNALLIIVDDASEEPFEGADFRFEENVGISKSKNKCIELLYAAGVTEFFLSDDDTYPIDRNWFKPYVFDDEPHLMFTFSHLKDGRPNGNRTIVSSNGLNVFDNPCGCLLYMNKSVIDRVGGFDENFKQYGYEHVNYSLRVFNAGLTRNPYQDILNSLKLFHSMDFHQEIKSSVQKNRSTLLFHNKRYFDSQKHSSDFKPYKELESVVITSFITKNIDPQRGESWPVDWMIILPLVKSMGGVKLIVLTDADPPKFDMGNVEFIPIENSYTSNPYWQRWFSYRDLLLSNRYKEMFLVDCSDVEMLRNPFGQLNADILYLGDEQGQIIRSPWLLRNHNAEVYQKMFNVGAMWRLLNAGLVGGRYERVLDFVIQMCEHYKTYGESTGLTDMAGFNFVAYSIFRGFFFHGKQVNTVFKSYTDNGIAWFKHK